MDERFKAWDHFNEHWTSSEDLRDEFWKLIRLCREGENKVTVITPTPFKDMEARDIWEGDWLRIQVRCMFNEYHLIDGLVVKDKRDGSWRLELDSSSIDLAAIIDDEENDAPVIIGNMFEQPDLVSLVSTKS